ncbi:MAG: DEAD/DEAH box helicase [Gammaproteobacteria bacterium]|nr:DEAD/DEAH box helicase [Gammaproteobacteria bacterium]MBV9619608.1 DEAD/DEAH box helicase [Gammaproteobacteria bacterium]
MSFQDLGLKPELVRAVAEQGYDAPTPIQAAAIPAVLAGRDVLAAAQTGTGKTAAFVLPLLERLGSPVSGAPRTLVLTPTRELAAQVAASATGYGRHLALRTVVIFGGVSERPQIEALRRGCDLLVATPGRLLDLAQQRVLDLRAVRCLVLDEADRMLDMGFIHAIRQILRLLPQERQSLLFSATYTEEIRALAARMLRAPLAIDVAPRNAAAERIEQQVYRVPREQKRHLLAQLIREGAWQQVLLFTRTKHGANRLTEQLLGAGIQAAAIHGNKSQNARVRALTDFKEGRLTVLVATEVAARGLDIKELPHVVNYELPNVPEDYVHRIGRTARAGQHGVAVSLVAPEEAELLRDIERLLGHSLEVMPLPALVPQSPERREAAHGLAHRPWRAPSHRPARPRHAPPLARARKRV